MSLQHITAHLLLPPHSDWTFDGVWRALAFGNIIVGGAFVLVAWVLALELVRAAGTVTSMTTDERSLAILTWIVLLSQGYMLLFCGYIENYALFTLFVALYLTSGLRALRRSNSGIAPALAFLGAVASHLSGLVLFPSLLFVYLFGSTRSRARLISVGGLLVAAVLAARYVLGYDLVATVQATVPSILQGTRTSFATWEHWRDVINAMLLACPFLVLGCALLGIRTTTLAPKPPGLLFLATAVVPYLAFVAALGDSNIGFARNWDLIAPVGVPLTALCLLWLGSAHVDAARRVLFVGVLLSLFHTVPWVLVNASEQAAIRRFATLPLGGGRVASTLGYWHLLQGRDQEAELSLAQAVKENPANVRAHYYRGRLYESQGRHEDAALAFQAAASLRPDIREFRFRGADIWRRQGQMAEALLALGDTTHTDAPTIALRSLLLYGSGNAQAAESAARLAAVIAADTSGYEALASDIRASVPYEELVTRYWFQIMRSGQGTGLPR